MKKRNESVIWAIVLLGIIIFVLIGRGFYQAPLLAQEKERDKDGNDILLLNPVILLFAVTNWRRLAEK